MRLTRNKSAAVGDGDGEAPVGVVGLVICAETLLAIITGVAAPAVTPKASKVALIDDQRRNKFIMKMPSLVILKLFFGYVLVN